MANWYCDYTNGDDTTGDGSSGTPWKTIQKTINSATGGDTIFIANTSAQVLAAAITWNTGWTANNNKYTIIQAWDNGGAITIQRPDEAIARVGATIDGNSSITAFISATSAPQKIVFKNLNIINFTGTTFFNEQSIIKGCAFTGFNVFGDAINLNLYCMVFNSYFYNNSCLSIINTNTGSVIQNNLFKNNPLSSTFSDRDVIRGNGNNILVLNNIFNNSRGGITCISFGAIVCGNTFLNITAGTKAGVRLNQNLCSVYNNIFVNIAGSGGVAIKSTSALILNVLGNNLFYANDSNMSSFTQVGVDLTANDITASGDPFVDSANDDYTLIESSAARQAALANPNSKLDIGAVQSEYGSGGGATG